ncbi:ferredoxin family protein [Halanaerobacter jeridensis]|uniref:Ferredoxin-like protein n=1 Tax=Halanaerobacter jeridensis TaxID=706427 RepID=A0A938XQQ7_9FIRM|nr:4Fe-4S dicluster domain-containing protein [Halanaerobacter jeridensis]MBM7555811.1 ferredoxin like protein [Halanaerobacter jeridensis]
MTKTTKELLQSVKISAAEESHIHIENKDICLEQCQKKYCTSFCPTNVFTWSTEQEKIIINNQHCIECLACPFGCPYNNIYWQFPPSGYGVEY